MLDIFTYATFNLTPFVTRCDNSLRTLIRIQFSEPEQTRVHTVIWRDEILFGFRPHRHTPSQQRQDHVLGTWVAVHTRINLNPGVKGNDRAGRPSGKATHTSGLLLGRSEVLRNLRHYLRTRAQSQGHHTIDRLEERGVERGFLFLDDLPWKDDRVPSSIRRTLEPFQRQRWRNFWETGRSAYEFYRAQRYHLELNWTVLALTNKTGSVASTFFFFF